MWGGAYNVIIPTDGKTIDDPFWAILEAFDPDYLYAYRKCGEDIRRSKPEEYQKALESHLGAWVSQFGHENLEGIRKKIDEDLRRGWVSGFDISSELQNQIKIRIAPFWFEQWIVEAGGISAGSEVRFPLAALSKIIPNTRHPDRFATLSLASDEVPRLWFAAVTGTFDEAAAEEMKNVGITSDVFDLDEGDVSQLIHFVITGGIERFWVHQPDSALLSISKLSRHIGYR